MRNVEVTQTSHDKHRPLVRRTGGFKSGVISLELFLHRFDVTLVGEVSKFDKVESGNAVCSSRVEVALVIELAYDPDKLFGKVDFARSSSLINYIFQYGMEKYGVYFAEVQKQTLV